MLTIIMSVFPFIMMLPGGLINLSFADEKTGVP
jgi:hypothetical protein